MSAPFPLDAEVVRGFVEAFLIDRFDERARIGKLHDQMWQLACSNHPRVAIAAPRKHGKSTALNHCYGLIAALSKRHPFQIKISATYDLAVEKLDQAKEELTVNNKLRSTFKLKRFIRERENDFIAEMEDGYRFRMIAAGMGQKVRGRTWGTMRPTLFLCDDMEDEKEVLNPDIRDDQWNWLMKTLLPMGSDNAQFRVNGTILHQQSMLNRLLSMKSWKSARYEACDEQISDASLLWRDKFSAATLADIKQIYVDAGNVSGFNMEYRNIAVDESTSFFRSSDFLPMSEEDHRRTKLFYVGGDLAYSKKEHRDYVVQYVGGIDEYGTLHIVDERRGRWDGKEVIDEMYRIEEAWHPEEWFIESGAILETLGTALSLRMADEGYLNIRPGLIPTKDKATRASPFQARMRSRAVRWDTEASWFPDAKQELMEFTQQGTRGAHDDRVDALAWLGQGLKAMSLPQTEDELDIQALAAAKREAAKQAYSELESCTGYEFWRAQR